MITYMQKTSEFKLAQFLQQFANIHVNGTVAVMHSAG